MKVLRALGGKLRAKRPGADAWVDGSAPLAPWVLFALLAPFWSSGAIRAVTGLSLPLALAVASAPSLVLAAVLGPWARWRALRERGAYAWSVEMVGAAVAALAVWALYIRDFHGFPNLDGWDGGSHVFVKNQFASIAPALYHGQVGYHALTWWLERLFGLGSLGSFAIAFHVTAAAVVLVPLAIAFGVVRERAGARRAGLVVGVVVAALGTVGAMWMVTLPLLHYNQAAGYYVHLFGLVPLVALWGVDAWVRHPALRVLALLGGVLALRYTYALNLADVALAVAGVFLLEGFRGRWRILQVLLVLGLALGANLVLGELRPIFRVWGGMQRFDVDRLRQADILIVAAGSVYLLAGALEQRHRSEWWRSSLVRAFRFPLLFGLASSLLVSVVRKGKGVQYYYVTKYQMWACILLATALVVIVAHLAVLLCERGWPRRPTLWLRVVAVAAVLALVPSAWGHLFIGYRTTLLERVRAQGPTYKRLRALADVEAVARIKRTLASENKRFGGYLTAFFPRFSFMNAELGYHAGYQDFFPPATEPGTCVFWVTPERDNQRLGPGFRLDALRTAVALPGSPCVEYSVPWKPTPQSLCHRCY